MDPFWKGVFFAIALVLFVLEAMGWRPRSSAVKPQFGGLGLAFFAFPFVYDAFAAS